MDLKIKGKNAFITGGTRGLGLASLKSLASEGVNIAYCSRSEEGIKKVKEYLSEGILPDIFLMDIMLVKYFLMMKRCIE